MTIYLLVLFKLVISVFSKFNDPLWWPENEEEFSNQNLLQPEVLVLSHQEDVITELKQGVRVQDLIHYQVAGQVTDVSSNQSSNQ